MFWDWNNPLQINTKIDVINEVLWHERSPLYDVLMQNRKRFIHFSSTPKLGVNPKKSHTDPHGIYFYPVNWLLTYVNDNDRDQYALDMPYYFLADIDFSSRGYLMSKMTMDDVEKIARENGWYPLLMNMLGVAKQDWPRMSSIFMDKPAKAMWRVLKNNREFNRSDNFGLKGIDYIYDDGTGTIHPNEPSQVLVLNPRILRNVTMGENRNVSIRATHAHNPIEEFEVWKKAMVDILKQVQTEYGGVIKWYETKDVNQAKKSQQTKARAVAFPQLEFSTHDSRRYILFFTKNYDLYLRRTYLRRVDTTKVVGRENLQEFSVSDYVERAKRSINSYEQQKIEISFKPAKNIDDVVKNIKDVMLTHPSEPEVEILNDTKKVYINGGVKMPFGLSFHYLGIIPDIDGGNVAYNITLRTKNNTLLVHGNDMPNLGKAVAAAFRQRIDGYLYETIGPKAEMSFRYGKFYYEDEWKAFVGWLVINSGVSANGIMEIVFKDEISAYNAYENKKALMRDIKRIMEEF